MNGEVRRARCILSGVFWAMLLGYAYCIYQMFRQGVIVGGIFMTVVLIGFFITNSYGMTGWDVFETISRVKKFVCR